MGVAVAPDKESFGSVVAFEGKPETVSTQLQLVPRSAQILLLPSIETYMPIEDNEWQLGYEDYIVAVDAAIQNRNDEAASFLQASTSKTRRLVVMAGGSPSALALCLERIMRQETNGDQKQAEKILREHIINASPDRRRIHAPYIKSPPYTCATHSGAKDDFQDPILKAMRAADALDLLTADLQPSNELDLTIQNRSYRSRSVSLPIYGLPETRAAVDAVPVPDIPPEHQMASPAPLKTPVFSTIHYDKPRGHSSPIDTTSLVSPGHSNRFSHISSTRAPSEFSASSPLSDGFSIQTIDDVVVGQASMLDFRNSIRHGSMGYSKRHSSLRPKTSGSDMPEYRGFGSRSSVSDCATVNDDNGGLSSNETIRPKSCMVVVNPTNPVESQLQSIDRPRTVLVKSLQSTIKLQPVPPEKKRRTPPAGNRISEDGTSDTKEPQSQNVPHFASLEDVVIYMKEDKADSVLHSAVDICRQGGFIRRQKSVQSLPTPRTKQSATLPGTPNTPSPEREQRKASLKTRPGLRSSDEYDPFAYTQPMKQLSEKPGSAPSTVTILRPPTPAQTPPPLDSMANITYLDIEATSSQTPVAVQNSIRSALSDYFSPHAQGYHQFQFDLLPEFDGMWSPMFRREDPKSSSKESSPHVKQILAISSQKRVAKEYVSSIYSRLEQMGSKDNVEGRCTRLNFKYLLANTMQAFTAQPLSKQTSDNPFSNPYFLATLIMPHLETYLALHADVRYLILEHPPEHLATVIALQKLAGSQLIKVAQVVESTDASRESPFRHMRGNSLDSLRSTSTISSRVSNSVSRPNLTLAARSSERDIAKFVAKIWDITTPDVVASPSAKKPKLSPLQSSCTSFSTMSAAADNGMTALSPPGRPSFSSQSFSDKSRKMRRSKTKTQPVDDGISVITYDPNEDSDYDQEERRLMPMFMQKKRSTKPVSTTKALRFLGLE